MNTMQPNQHPIARQAVQVQNSQPKVQNNEQFANGVQVQGFKVNNGHVLMNQPNHLPPHHQHPQPPQQRFISPNSQPVQVRARH